MKGIAIERAVPANILDLYGLMKQAQKEGAMPHPCPNEVQMKAFYFPLLEELGHQQSLIFLARKGRSYLGYLRAQLVLRPFGTHVTLFVSGLFVTKNKRKLGIGAALVQHLRSEAEKIGITEVEFISDPAQTAYWFKQVKAEQVGSVLRAKV